MGVFLTLWELLLGEDSASLPKKVPGFIKHWWAVVNLCGTSWERSAKGQGRLTMRLPDWPTSMKEKYHSPKENKKA